MKKKKINELIIGSNNKGKIKEISDLLPKYYDLFSPHFFKLKSPKENGKTFIQNSLIKAKYFLRIYHFLKFLKKSGEKLEVMNLELYFKNLNLP